MNGWQYIKHFKQSEFDSPDVKGSGVKMYLPLVQRLDFVRETLKMPLRINSG